MGATSIMWQEVKLGDLAEFHDHKRVPLSKLERGKCQGKYPYYGASGIIDYIDDYIFDGRYLLIAEDGENLNSRKTPVAFFANGKFWVNNHAHVIRAIKGIADDYFIKAWFDQANISGYITGAAQPKLSQANLKKVEILLPPLPIQRKIASILSAYDDLIENNTRRIQILEDMAQAIYREWFVHFRFPGHEHVKLVESELGMIPEGWKIVKVGGRFKVLLGGTPSRKVDKYWQNGSVPWINSSKANELRVIKPTEFITEEALNNSAAKLLPKRTTLIAITGATLGQVSLLEIESAANQSIVGVFDKEEYFSEYLYLKICEDIEKIIGKASGSAQQHINKRVVDDTKILIPNKLVINKFNNIIHPYFDLVVNLMRKNQNLKNSRDLLLPRLISGNLDVSEMEIQINEEVNV